MPGIVLRYGEVEIQTQGGSLSYDPVQVRPQATGVPAPILAVCSQVQGNGLKAGEQGGFRVAELVVGNSRPGLPDSHEESGRP